MHLISCFLILVCFESALGYTCNEAEEICETSLVVEHYLTMTSSGPDFEKLYAEDGKLWRYDVTNTSTATPISENGVIITDGWETQQLVVVANRTMPGPDIIVYEGQTLIIHVHNKLLSDSVTIHWHGHPQEGTPYMDGVAFVTQCPIMAGQSFTYKFRASPKGSCWYHAHIGAQRAKGLFGAFIIREREDNPLPEHILQIQGWNHEADADLGFQHMIHGIYRKRQKLHASQSVDGSLFSLFDVQSGLINGKGRYKDQDTGEVIMAPLEIFNVVQGQDYRFRAIGVGLLYPFRISVDDHRLTIIESDAYGLKPITVDSLIINPGERYDFILHANQSINNYWVRGQTLEINKETVAQAILRYSGAQIQEPKTSNRSCSENDKCVVLNCPFTYFPANDHIQCLRIDHLKSANNNDLAPAVVLGKFQEFFLNFGFPGTTSITPSSVNGRKFIFPTVSGISQPSQVDTNCKKENCGEQRICNCTHSLDLQHGNTVQMVFTNMGIGSGWAHPIHMHGHSFYVLKMGYAEYNETTGRLIAPNSDIDCRGGTPKNASFCNDATWSNSSWANGNVPGLELQNPVRKDTIIVPSGGYVVIRIKADNPGLWIMHCHIELHASDGMILLLNESFGELPEVPNGFPTCSSYPPPPSNQLDQKKEEGMFQQWEFCLIFVIMCCSIAVNIGICIYCCYQCCKNKKDATGNLEGKSDKNLNSDNEKTPIKYRRMDTS